MTVTFDVPPYVLSPLDHTIPKIYVSFFLSFALENIDDGLLSIKIGIVKLLHRLPYLAGDIILHEKADGHENLQSVVDPDKEINPLPMLQVKYHPELSLREIASKKVRSGMENLHLAKKCAPLPDFINPQERRPIVRFAANVMEDGILLAMTINHSFFDGSGAGTILEALAECCRTPNRDLSSPIFTLSDQISREGMALLSVGVDADIDHSKSYNAAGTVPCLSSAGWSTMVESFATNLTSCRLQLSAQKLNDLRDACNRILSDTKCADWPSYVSSNDVVSALIAICRGKCHSKKDSHDTELTTIVNLRSRVEPPFPDHYLGNMITAVRSLVGLGSSEDKLHIRNPSQAGKLGITPEDLVQISMTAARIRQSVLAIDNRYVRSLFGYLPQQKAWNAINMQASDFSVSSWRDWKVYDFDFGPDLGSVSHFQMHFGLNDGLTVIMPAGAAPSAGSSTKRKKIGASWDMQLMIQTTDLSSLTSSPLFQWAFGDLGRT
ncbi:hypothetical protein N7478_004610 [Penicillium angulare]|uniref:uncharacterized protein n=1 Tax=Penicillium angulare TaxID=116970 RepID=UPI00254165E5|nr:uncharacterized protein N7478_004610 [Penicillium angulare]KAJ5279238.1 hypothetical protein N7478_004610 [Penicillium angulare]